MRYLSAEPSVRLGDVRGSRRVIRGGKREIFTRRELARMGLAKPATRRGRVIPFRDVLKGMYVSAEQRMALDSNDFGFARPGTGLARSVGCVFSHSCAFAHCSATSFRTGRMESGRAYPGA